MPGRYSTLPDNIDEIDNLGLPSPYQFLWTTTLAYSNVYFVTYNIFVGIGLPIKTLVFSKEEIASILIPENSADSSEILDDMALEYLKFIDASQIVDTFVLKIKKFQKITNRDDIRTGLNLWNSIVSEMANFMNTISIATNHVYQNMINFNITSHNISTVEPMSMIYLYKDIFDQIVETVLSSTAAYREALNFVEKFNTELKLNNNEVSWYS